MKTYFFIMPAVTDLALKCNIYSIVLATKPSDLLQMYRTDPSRFTHVGHMNSQGKLVAFDGPSEARQEFLDCEPLMAGLTVSVDWIAPQDVMATAQRMVTNHGHKAAEFAGDHAYRTNGPGTARNFWLQVSEQICLLQKATRTALPA